MDLFFVGLFPKLCDKLCLVMSKRWPFSLLNDEQMSNKVRVEHQPVNYVISPDIPESWVFFLKLIGTFLVLKVDIYQTTKNTHTHKEGLQIEGDPGFPSILHPPRGSPGSPGSDLPSEEVASEAGTL